MGTKMKGLLKGLKQFSNRFDDKEEEMQIGLPTDVKHVAHIGWDGPSLESPSWMKEYKGKGGGAAQSAPLDFLSAPPVEDSEKKWVSQDSSRKKSIKSPARDLPELPKSSRRQSTESPAASPSRIRDPSKSRSSRRQLRKESDSSRGSRRTKELSNDAPDQADIPKKTRRKKSKDSSVHRSSKSKEDKDKEPSDNGISQDSLPQTSFSDPFSEPGSDNIDTITRSPGNELLPASKLKPFVPEVEKANVAVA